MAGPGAAVRTSTADGYRYEQLITFIKGLIDGGDLAPGARLPSVREISLQRRISISTVLQAYRRLEDQGLIEARPQSGFYVGRKAASSLPKDLRRLLRKTPLH